MTTTVPAGIPAQPEQPPAVPVDLTKTTAPDARHGQAVPGDEARPAQEERRGLGSRLKEGAGEAAAADGPLAAHLRRAARNTRSWLRTDDLTTEDVTTAVLEDRRRQYQARETQLRQELARISSQIVTAKRTETTRADNDPHRDGPEVVALKGRRELVQAQLEEHQHTAGEAMAVAPTEGELARARWGRKAGRAAALVGGVVGGGVVLPMQDPRLLLASLPAAAVALWRAGVRADEPVPGEDGAPAVMASQGLPGAEPAQREVQEEEVPGPGFAAAVLAARQAAEQAVTPGAVAARQVAEAAEQAAQVQGSSDLITALLKAGIIGRGEEDETKVIGVIRPDGPGWTVTIELPGGKTAAQAISKDTELASALKVKAPQLQLSADTSEEGHEGRFVIWCANKANPYAGPIVKSELIDAERWEFWSQGVPLGSNARGVRKVLNMIWSSLLIGGLMNYGKSYLARLIAAAAALDPYVKIVLLTGKTGADWAALKLVADSYVSGNSPAVIRQMHTVMEDTIAEMSAKGERLERLFEDDPKACPEGKITPELARTEGLELTLLVVEELQEILDAAAGMKLHSTDDEADLDEGGRKPAGRNGKDVLVSLFARFIRVARYVGGMEVIITQRPDSNSVPTLLREVAPKRACYRVKGRLSSKMVLGDDAVDNGAAPHLLMEHHKGVVVLDDGGEEGHDTVRADVINLDDFRLICERGRDLRLKSGTLTGQALARWEDERERVQRQKVLTDAVAAMDAHGVDRARLVVLAEWMAALAPEHWHDLTETSLGVRLREAGAGTTARIGAVDGVAKASGYLREQLAEAATARAA
ncbi:hypothetical protein ACFVXG_20435 [Kitasatospora sp. NPDC058162]|uniref:hypothetical protein n=1 Tax=Kitasatospora sp. NPDC058162 TaxID=3346362 RepID=UPI0036DA2D4B